VNYNRTYTLTGRYGAYIFSFRILKDRNRVKSVDERLTIRGIREDKSQTRGVVERDVMPDDSPTRVNKGGILTSRPTGASGSIADDCPVPSGFVGEGLHSLRAFRNAFHKVHVDHGEGGTE
jgi:hypothetical protein